MGKGHGHEARRDRDLSLIRLFSRVCQFNWRNNEETLLFNHLWSRGLLFFGPSQFYGSFLLYRGPKQLKHIQAGDELGFGMPLLDFRGLCLYIASNDSK